MNIVKSVALAGALLGLSAVSSLAATVYSNDFSVNNGGFSGASVTNYGSFGPFLGILTQGATATLSLSGLAANAAVSVAFDLYTLRSLDGNYPGYDDHFVVKMNGVTQFDETFSNFPGQQVQSYGGVNAAPGTGAVASTPSQWPGAVDFTYHLVFAGFADGSGNLVVDFIGNSGQEVADEGFGIDNVSVSVSTVPVPAGLPLLAGAIGLIGLMRRRKA